MKILEQNFSRLFLNSPNSEKELFENIKKYISLDDPNWFQSCKPAPKEDIERLEKMLLERFGRGIPSPLNPNLNLRS